MSAEPGRGTGDSRAKRNPGALSETGRLREAGWRDDREGLDFGRWHERARQAPPGFAQSMLRPTTGPLFRLLYRMELRNPENLPASGPVLIAANHASFLDHAFIGHGSPRPVNAMSKSQLFTPWTSRYLSAIGAFPIRRGSNDAEAHATALAILAREGVLIMYPQGGRARGSEFGDLDRVHSGIARLAFETGAPIVPTALRGTAQIRDWKRGRFPKVTVIYGRPMHVSRDPEAPLERCRELAREAMEKVLALFEGEAEQ